MEANGGGVGGGLEDGGDHALANGGGGHAPANGALANGGGHGLANHAPANGGGHALANGLANGGDQVPAMEAVAGMGAGGAVGNGGLQVMVAPNGVVPAQAVVAAANPHALYVAFLRLPAQEIARCRRVCRLWRDITGTEDFRRDHHRHRYRTPMPLFFFQGPGPFHLRAVDVRDRVSRPVIRYPSHHEVLRIHGSCAGILLLSSGDRLYACNPCTRRWTHLPPLHVDNHIIGFYATGVYEHGHFGCQVLYHDRQEPDCEYWIFQLGLGAAAAASSIGRRGLVDDVHLDLVLANGVAPSYMIPPVYVLHFLHWLPRATRHNRGVLMFDAGAESFALIPPPGIQVGGPVVGDQLFEIDEHLAMAVISSPSRVDVWVRSNNTELWSRRYSIRLPMYEINLNGGYHFNGALTSGVFAVAQDRNDLVQCPSILLQCDALGAVLQSYQLADYQTYLYRHTIQESLLLHPSILPMQDTDAADGDPPFFRNQ